MDTSEKVVGVRPTTERRAKEGKAGIISELGVERGRRGNGPIRGEHPYLTNRVREIAWHIPWYGFKTQVRLAQDSGVSPAAISRLIRGESQPTLYIALRVAAALSRRLNQPIDTSEIFSLDGDYPTPSVCRLTGCPNCLPPAAYDNEGNLKPEYGDVKAGAWSLASSPAIASEKGNR